MTEYALEKGPGSFWPEIREDDVRVTMIGNMMRDLSYYDFPDLENVVREMIEKHQQLERNEITISEFDEYWEEVKMIRKLLRDY